MTRTRAALALCLPCVLVVALQADRLSDRDIKEMLDRIKQDANRFEDALDDDLKHKVIRGPAGEVDVEQYLEDFERRIDLVKDRFTPELSASVETADMLRQASAIDAFIGTQDSAIRGTSEWNRLKDSLQRLAGAYGTTFPLQSNATVRRLNDREVVTAAKGVSEHAAHIKKTLETALKRDPAVTPQQRQTLAAPLDDVVTSARLLASLAGDGRPSSAEAQALAGKVWHAKTILAGQKLETLVGSAWTAIGSNLQVIADAYK